MILYLKLQLFDFGSRCFSQVWVDWSRCSFEVLLVVKVCHAGSLISWRQILLDEVVDLLRSCFGGKPIFPFEQEDSLLRYFGNPLHVLSAWTSTQCLVVPITSIVLVKCRLTCVLTLLAGGGVDFIAERKDNGQISRVDRSYGVLENCKTVGVFITRSHFLLENENGQVNSYFTWLFINPFIVGLLPLVSRHVRIVEPHRVNEAIVFECEKFGCLRAPVSLEGSMELILIHSAHSV